jgi:hypothetical protein
MHGSLSLRSERRPPAGGCDRLTKKGENGMKAVIVIVNACIWGFAMVMSSHRLSGTGAYQEIQMILGGCAAASLLVVGLGIVLKPKQSE